MKKELTTIEKILFIEEMLNKLGYDTDKMTVDEALKIKNDIEKIIVKTQVPIKDYIHPLNNM